MKDCRAAASRVIMQVLQGQSMSDCLPKAIEQLSDPRDQSLLQALCYGVCRHYFTLADLVDRLLTHPLKGKDSDIYALLLVGLYQLMHMRIPPYAAVDATVAATKTLQKDWARGLVNAVLREYQRQEEALLPRLAEHPDTAYAHPDWLIGMLKKAWPNEWEAILVANNAHPPFTLRVNQQQATRDAYLAELMAHDLPARPLSTAAQAVILDEPVPVHVLPGFATGAVSVQDGAAQLAAELLELQPGQRVLDACAAPGGKTAHIAETQPNLAELLAVDIDAERLNAVHENAARLQLTITTLAADVGDSASWWDGRVFDRILLDAPCSATGVIRRHPDIKLLRRADDIAALVAEQLRLLTAVWPLLKSGGILLYATCSVLPRENAGVIKQFLAAHTDALERPLPTTWGVACDVGRQILPGTDDMDGFYYARLEKSNEM